MGEIKPDYELDRSTEQEKVEKPFVPSVIEMGAEHIPNKEEVANILRQIIGGEFKSLKSKEDEQGLYSWSVEVPGEKPGEIHEYEYRRGVFGPQSKGKWSSIAVIYLDADGMPIGGKTVADCVEGVWQIK